MVILIPIDIFIQIKKLILGGVIEPELVREMQAGE
jgi:hypothetical protein